MAPEPSAPPRRAILTLAQRVWMPPSTSTRSCGPSPRFPRSIRHRSSCANRPPTNPSTPSRGILVTPVCESKTGTGDRRRHDAVEHFLVADPSRSEKRQMRSLGLGHYAGRKIVFESTINIEFASSGATDTRIEPRSQNITFIRAQIAGRRAKVLRGDYLGFTRKHVAGSLEAGGESLQTKCVGAGKRAKLLPVDWCADRQPLGPQAVWHCAVVARRVARHV